MVSDGDLSRANALVETTTLAAVVLVTAIVDAEVEAVELWRRLAAGSLPRPWIPERGNL